MALLPMMSWAQTAITSVEVKDFTYQGDLTWIEVRKHVFINGVAAETGYNLSYKDEQGNDIAEADLHDAGFYTVTITGTGTYTGSKTADKTFEVRQAGLTVNILKAEQEYSRIPIVKYSLYGDFKSGDTEDNVAIAFTILEAGDPDHFYDASDDPYPIYDPKTTHITATSKNYIIGVNVASNALLTVTGLKIDDIVFTAEAATYNGNVQTPGIKADDMTLGTDYVVDYTNPESKDADTYTAKVTGIGNFSGTKVVNYTIAQLTITDINIADITEEFIFANDEKKPTLTVTSKEGALPMVLDQDFTVVYLDNKNAGVATAKAEVTVNKTDGNFTFEAADLKKTATFTINPRSIVNGNDLADGFTASGFGSQTYKGAAWEITPNITYEPQGALTNGVDYDLAYANNINVTYDEKGKVAEAAEVTVTGKGNFTGEYVHTFKINPKNIANIPDADIVLNDGKAIKYQAEELEPSVAITDNAVPAEKQTLAEGEDKDYVVAYANNINVTTTESKATVTIAGKGNYKGTKEIEFEIGKGELYIQPVSGSCAIGSVPDMKWDWVDGKGPQGADKDIAKDEFFTGVQPIVKRVEPGLAVGTYNLMVVLDGDDADDETNVTHPNYDVIAVNKDGDDNYVAQWEITKQNVVIKSKEIASEEYGYALPAELNLTAKDKFPFEVEGLIYNEEITALTYVVKQKDGDKTYVGGENLPVGTYVVEIQNPETGTLNYVYDLTEAKADFVITPKAVTIAINNATKTYGGDDPVFTYTKPVSTELANGEEWDDLGLTPTLTREKGEVIGKEYAINGSLESDNYTFTFTPGVFTITPGVFALNRVPSKDYENADENTAADYVANYDGVEHVNVTFSMYNYEGTPAVKVEQAFKAKKWYSLVLPFETNIQELSAAFGYAVVNTLAGMNGDKVRFALHMEETLPANTPFLVKIWKDKTLAEVNGFTDKKIVAPTQVDENGDPYVVEDGVRFIGTYKGKVGGFRSNEWFFTMAEGYNEYYKGSDTNNTYLRPLGAYLQAQPGVEVRGIEVQEADGTYTAIEAVEMANNNAESLYTIDGKKVQKAAQKGVYIQNGKKVILK